MTFLVPGKFPSTRLRRNRRDPWSRKLVAENVLSAGDFIWPVFIHDGSVEPVPSMPDVSRLPIPALIDAVGAAKELGIPCVALFPAIEAQFKTDNGAHAWDEGNVICRAVSEIKRQVPDIGILCDVALDPFTSHGHDGLIGADGHVMNDATIEALIRQTLAQARAGCDIIAPSDMMDGRIGALRTALDEAGFEHVRLMSYAAKYASAFYGPFRDAIGSKKGSGPLDKRGYQMDPANSDEALREVALDLGEGADMVMVKPGMPYLDIVRRVKETFLVPTYAYQVSGEYAMLMGAVERGWMDERVVLESLMAFKRAGCDGILTYFAIDAAKRLKAG